MAALILLSACASVTPLTSRPHPHQRGPVIASTEWRCPDGKSFRVAFAGAFAHVNASGHEYRLPHARSGSGARYAGGGVEYWEHAGEAMLHGAAGGPYERCRH